jgi:hypothetical protein
MLCVFLFIAAGIVAVRAIGSSRVGASTSLRQNHMRQRVEDNASHPKIAPWVIEHTANGQKTEFFVVLANQADLRGAAALTTKSEKGRYVYHALKNKSQATQGTILQWSTLANRFSRT